MPWRVARARIWLGVSAPPGLPGDLDVRDALGERRDLGEGGVAEVDDPPRDAVGATVVDYHSDGLAVVEIGHRDHRPEGEAEVGRVVTIDPTEVVPGGLPDLRSVRAAGGLALEEYLVHRRSQHFLRQEDPIDLAAGAG